MPKSPQGALQVQWKVGPGGSVGVLYAWWVKPPFPFFLFSSFPLFLKHIVSLCTQVLFRWFWIQYVIWRPQMRCFHHWEDQYELRKERRKAFGLLPLLSTMCCFWLNRDGELFMTWLIFMKKLLKGSFFLYRAFWTSWYVGGKKVVWIRFLHQDVYVWNEWKCGKGTWCQNDF